MPITISGSTGIAGVDGSASTPAVQGTDTNTGIVFPAADTVTVATGGTERMRVDSSGNVGIGTTSTTANAKLAVEQGIVARASTAGLTPYLQLYNSNAGTDLKTWRLGGDSGGSLSIETVNDAYSAATQRLIINSSGNLQFNSGYGSVATAYGCRAWVNFNGTGTVAIRTSGNVTSITDNGTGDYTVNFTNAMPDANYSYEVSAGNPTDVPRICLNATGGAQTESAPTTSSCRFFTNNAANSAQLDCKYINVVVFR